MSLLLQFAGKSTQESHPYAFTVSFPDPKGIFLLMGKNCAGAEDWMNTTKTTLLALGINSFQCDYSHYNPEDNFKISFLFKTRLDRARAGLIVFGNQEPKEPLESFVYCKTLEEFNQRFEAISFFLDENKIECEVNTSSPYVLKVLTYNRLDHSSVETYIANKNLKEKREPRPTLHLPRLLTKS